MTVLDYLIEPLRCYSISAVYLEYLLCLSKAAYAAEKECQRAVAVVAVANCRSVGTWNIEKVLMETTNKNTSYFLVTKIDWRPPTAFLTKKFFAHYSSSLFEMTSYQIYIIQSYLKLEFQTRSFFAIYVTFRSKMQLLHSQQGGSFSWRFPSTSTGNSGFFSIFTQRLLPILGRGDTRYTVYKGGRRALQLVKPLLNLSRGKIILHLDGLFTIKFVRSFLQKIAMENSALFLNPDTLRGNYWNWSHKFYKTCFYRESFNGKLSGAVLPIS